VIIIASIISSVKGRRKSSTAIILKRMGIGNLVWCRPRSLDKEDGIRDQTSVAEEEIDVGSDTSTPSEGRGKP
jgi:hypothetical protein